MRDSDGTVWFGYALAPGGRVTLGHCKKLGRPHLVNPPAAELTARVAERGVRTLTYQITYETLVRAFDPLREGPIVEPSSRAR